MKFLLGADTCVCLIRQDPEPCSYFKAVSPEDVAITTMTEASLRYSAIRSPDLTTQKTLAEQLYRSFKLL